jgi:hypothetical protein
VWTCPREDSPEPHAHTHTRMSADMFPPFDLMLHPFHTSLRLCACLPAKNMYLASGCMRCTLYTISMLELAYT